MKRKLIIISLMIIFFTSVVSASSVNQLEADGSAGYRKVGLSWAMDSVEEDTTIEIWMNASSFLSLIHISEPTRPY